VGGDPLVLGDALRVHGVAAEPPYPYTSYNNVSTDICEDVARRVVVSLVETPLLPWNNSEDAMAAYVRFRGPLQVSIDASDALFRTYSGGIIDTPTTVVSLNHGVTIMGIGVDDGVPYWTVKNSWGPQWGENGYFRLQRGLNLFGIAEMPLGFQVVQ
jgi:hypothetical protein